MIIPISVKVLMTQVILRHAVNYRSVYFDYIGWVAVGKRLKTATNGYLRTPKESGESRRLRVATPQRICATVVRSRDGRCVVLSLMITLA